MSKKTKRYGVPVRWYDKRRNRTVCASPNFLTVWAGRHPVGPDRLIAGPLPLPLPLPSTQIELVAAYSDWLAAGEPA